MMNAEMKSLFLYE